MGIVAGIVDSTDTVVVRQFVRHICAESEFSESVSVRIRLDFHGFRHGRSGGERRESRTEDEENLFNGIRIRRHFSEISADANVGKRSEIVRIMEGERIFVHGETSVDRIVFKLELNRVPGVVGKGVEGFRGDDFQRWFESEVIAHSGISHEVHAKSSRVRGIRIASGTYVSGRTSVRVARRRRENVFEPERRKSDLVLRKVRIRFERRYRRTYGDGIHAVGFLGRVRIVGVKRISYDVARVSVSVPVVVDRPVLKTVVSEKFRTVVEFPTGTDGPESGYGPYDVPVRIFQFDPIGIRVCQVAHRRSARRSDGRIGIERSHSRDDRNGNRIGSYVTGTVLHGDSYGGFAFSVGVVLVDISGDVAEVP